MLDLCKYICREKSTEAKVSKGFTLVELAVVLTLVGLLVAGSISGFLHQRHKEQVRTTDVKMAKVLDSLSVYAQRYNRIPCPASPTAAGAQIGAEKDNGQCFKNTGEANGSGLYANSVGIVPWRELGLRESDVRDAWGNYFTYKPAPNLTVDNTSTHLIGANANSNVHSACRMPAWYSNGVHLNRAKALFCCNAAPTSTYLASTGHSGGNVNLPVGWRDQAIVAAGAIPASTTLGAASTLAGNIPVVSTNAWIDKDSDFYGQFETPVAVGDRHAPAIRASGLAVALVSHGSNSKFSFISGALNRVATNASGVATETAGADELFNYSAPHVVAATVNVPKVSEGRLDPMGKRAGASDDRVVYLRTDQLYSRVGNATCLKPTGGTTADTPDLCEVSPASCQCPAVISRCEPVVCPSIAAPTACYRATLDGHLSAEYPQASTTRPAAMSAIATYGGKFGYTQGNYYRVEALPTNYTPSKAVPRDFTCNAGGDVNCKVFGTRFSTAPVASCDQNSCGCMPYPQVGDNCGTYFQGDGRSLYTLNVSSVAIDGNNGIIITCGASAPRQKSGAFAWVNFQRLTVPSSQMALYEANIPATCKKPPSICTTNPSHWSCTADICDDPMDNKCAAPGYSGDYPCKCDAECNPCAKPECTVSVCDDGPYPLRPEPMLPASNESGDCTCCSNPPSDQPTYNPAQDKYHIVHPITKKRVPVACSSLPNLNVNTVTGCP